MIERNGRAGSLCALLILGCLLWVAGTALAWATEFRGQYNGIGAAAGMTLVLQEADGRIVGRFAPLRGEDFAINGRRTGEAAQGSLQRASQSSFFHLEMRPMGVQFLLIPAKPDGGPDLSGATDYSFVREGTVIPEPSEFEPAPPRGVPVDIFQFIDSYRDWDPKDMARIYEGMDSRYRELVQLFDHASAEILWRICVTSPPGRHFSEAALTGLLERQQTDCVTYLDSVRAMRDAGFFPEFVRKANFQFELIRETVKCDRDMSPESKCADVGVMSAPLMMSWQSAMGIMAGFVDEDERQTAQVPEPTTGQAPPVPAARPEARATTPSDVVEDPTPEVTVLNTIQDLELAPGVPVPLARPGTRPQSRTVEEMPVEEAPAPEPELVPSADAASAYDGYLPRVRPGVRLRR